VPAQPDKRALLLGYTIALGAAWFGVTWDDLRVGVMLAAVDEPES
jgi:hypothetical protein